MKFDVLKLIDTSLALSHGGHLPIADAAESIGVDRDQLLRVAASGGLALFARLPTTDGYILPFEDLERESSPSGIGGSIGVPAPKYMPESALQTQLRGLLAVPVQEAIALSSAILSEALLAVPMPLFDAPSRPGYVFAPDTSPLIDVDAIEVDAAQVAALQKRLASKITQAQIDRARAQRDCALEKLDLSAGKKADQLFSAALEAYATDTTGIPGSVASETEQNQKRRGCALFIELMGDLPLNSISEETLRKFRAKLKELPANQNHIPKTYQRATLMAAYQAMKDDGIVWPAMTEAAQHERMLWLSQMFRWLAKGWIKDNPMSTVLTEQTKTAAERKAENQERARRKEAGEPDESDTREPFTPEELRAIFGLSQFQTGNGSLFDGNESSWYPCQYWLPLIGLFAGCRIKEVSQLYLSDIRQSDDGVWLFDINETTPDKSLKNASASRQIPIASMLIDLGLIEYRQRLQNEGYRRLFPELTHSKSDARYSKESKRRMSAMFEGLGMPRDGTKVFHCLRANFNDGLLRVPFSDLTFDDPNLKHYIRFKVVGHALENVNEKHYTSTTMVERRALIEGLAYDLPPIAKFDFDYAVDRIQFALSRKLGKRRGREDMGPMNSSVYGS